MCVSRFYKVLRRDGVAWVEVEDVNRVVSRASLLAYEGDELSEGDWVSVNSGYVIDRVESDLAAMIVHEIRQAQVSRARGVTW